MIELNPNHRPSQALSDLERLQQVATSRRDRFRQQTFSINSVYNSLTALSASPIHWFKKFPARYLLHTVVAFTVPAALALSQLPSKPLVEQQLPVMISSAELPIGIGPISLDEELDAPFLVGDPPLDEDAAMPLPLSLGSLATGQTVGIVPATIAGDVVKLRSGPGQEYDDIMRLNGGTAVEVLGRHDDWLQVREQAGAPTYWVATELVHLPEATLLTLNSVPESVIPPPPPPKIGTLIENNVNLRDGPGTNYVPMAKMAVTQGLTLIEQYEGWFLVEYGELYGWVNGQLMQIGPGVLERVPVAKSIPDPNPPLVGNVLENKVNLRKGPGSAYDKVSSVNAGVAVDLLARHKDWYKVGLSNGTKAWIFSDFLKVAPMAKRRVPVTNNIPALPVKQRANANVAGGVPNIPASGDVAGFAVQFAGSRYVWGGASPAGFDCSGLTRYVYRQFGVNLPHSAAAQFSGRYGAVIGSMGNLAPGDLVFFAGTTGRRGITHVALYIGGGRVVHAMTPRYGVQVSSIFTSYWQSHFAGAIRPYR
jgi:cell wall-associated NlpC family hydrolase